MKQARFPFARFFALMISAFTLTLAIPAFASAPSEFLLYSFHGGANGCQPSADMVSDSAGNLYGTTVFGGTYDVGTVFKLSPSAGSWNETILYSFTGGTDGYRPLSGVAVDSAGNVFGETSLGGTQTAACGFACGVVFKITP